MFIIALFDDYENWCKREMAAAIVIPALPYYTATKEAKKPTRSAKEIDPMSKPGESKVALIVSGAILPVLGFAAWDQALDFDPCANIFVRPGRCITSGLSLAAGGVFLVVLGGILVASAARRRRAADKSFLAVLVTGWLGFWMAAIGAAIIFAGLSIS